MTRGVEVPVKRIPMMLQLVLSLFCFMAIPMAILTWYSEMKILLHSENAIAESSLAGLHAVRELNEKALNHLAQDVVRLAATKMFDSIRHFETYAEANANYDHVKSTQAVLQELHNLTHRVEGIYSTYFYLDGADYVISTDKGITRLEQYESLDWLEEALADRQGISGVWVPRQLASGVNVISYVLPLNRLSTTTRGTIVVNLKEAQISDYLRASEPGQHGYFLLGSDGLIISHQDKNLLFTDANELPVIGEILRQSARDGYVIHEVDGERLIYTWSRSDQFPWWTIHIYSMDELMSKALKLQRSIMWLTVLIIVLGAVMAVLLATWLSKPVRQLVRAVGNRINLGLSKMNELAFLESAFRRMQEDEEKLYQLLKEREQDAHSLAIHHLLRGEVTRQAGELFPHPYFRIAVVAIDQYKQYQEGTNPETRSYHRYVFLSQCERLFPEHVRVRGVYYGEGCFVLVLNYGEEWLHRHAEELQAALETIRDQAPELFGRSVTIGVSSQTDERSRITDRLVEAMEVIKHRLIGGTGGITFWEPEPDRDRKYIYPSHSERRILNFLDIGDLESINKELELIRDEIRSAEYISYDNILFIYNQLVGVTIKHLRENNISTSGIFAGRRHIYSAIASFDTLEELENCLKEFFAEIVRYMARHPGKANYGERILRYLEEHYCEDIVFEDMAREIGISYSYMRKIFYEVTGKSLIEYTNWLRIQKAKQIMLESDSSMAQIAASVGYANVQSFNRFFRKFEGMSPSHYKALKLGT